MSLVEQNGAQVEMVERINIQLNAGGLNLSYEGSAEFFENKMISWLEKLPELEICKLAKADQQSEQTKTSQEASNGFDLSTHSIASKLKADSGPKLALAAMAKLHFSDNKERVDRKAILAEMKTVPSIYKENMSKNLTGIINSLVKAQKINGLSNKTFSLAEQQLDDLRNVCGLGT